MKFLIFNAGSSSLKVSVAENETITAQHSFSTPPMQMSDEAWAELLNTLRMETGGYDVVVNRVVHGGAEFGHAALIDDQVQAQIEALTDMAPLHQPPSVFVMAKLRQFAPDAIHVACFDTAFHATIPEGAYTYAVPLRWRREFGIRKFGFHGLAHEYNVKKTAELLGRPLESLKIVSAHLGSGASLCAVLDGKSLDTTMGFTPLDGLVMGTRSGTLDPSVPAWLVERAGVSYEKIVERLSKESGLMGLAGDTHMGHIADRARRGEAEATLALEVWMHRTVSLVGQMAAAMGGIDALVFSGGIGENCAPERGEIVRRLAWLGFELDAVANAANRMDTVITTPASTRQALVVESREDLTMIRQAAALVAEMIPDVG